jgi:hypothetical protein
MNKILKIRNKSDVDDFFRRHMLLKHNLVSIPGKAPEGSTYNDGDLITRPVAIAWACCETKDRVEVIYE